MHNSLFLTTSYFFKNVYSDINKCIYFLLKSAIKYCKLLCGGEHFKNCITVFYYLVISLISIKYNNIQQKQNGKNKRYDISFLNAITKFKNTKRQSFQMLLSILV